MFKRNKSSVLLVFFVLLFSLLAASTVCAADNVSANFTSNVTNGSAPLSVQFNDTSSGNATSWSWNFGDNSTSTEQNPAHVYKSLGNFSVSLNVSNANANSSISRLNYISTGNTTTFSGGQPTMPEAILMIAVNGTVADDFVIHLTSSGYQWDMNTPAVGNDFTTTNLTYVNGALNETFTASDLIYSSYYKFCSLANYPIVYGQNMADTNNTFYIMFVDLYAGCLQTGTDNGAIKVDYNITGLTSANILSFNVYGWYSASNHGTGIIMTNSQISGASGYVVQGVSTTSVPVADFVAGSTSGDATLHV
ncbi:MAG: PKD domain-containing protein, partial [Methanobacterium sp.]|nr:PKD domain-containing protein [Methanobacterium sp.]